MKRKLQLLTFLFLLAAATLQAQETVEHYVKASLNATLKLSWGSENYGTIQWQTSKDQGQTWTDISGANAPEYTVKAPASGKLYYRVVVNGDEACEPFVQTHVLNVVTFNVTLLEYDTNSATFEVSGLNIPAADIVEYGTCYSYSGLNRTYASMPKQPATAPMPSGDTFQLSCSGLLPAKSYSVRVYFKTKDGSTVYGPGKLVSTLDGLEWSTEGWTITKNSVRARVKLSGYSGSTPKIYMEFGTAGNMQTYNVTPVPGQQNVFQSALINNLQPSTDYIARMKTTIDGEEQVIEKVVRTRTDYSTYAVDNTVKPVKHRITWVRNLKQLNPDNIQAEYPRLLRISEDTILLAYHGGEGTSSNVDHWQHIFLQRSVDNGKTWSAPEKFMDKNRTYTSHGWYRFCNPELVKLQNGWVVMSFIGNANPETNANCQVLVSISKDGGNTWGDPITVMRGRCWEPMIVQLPGGDLELLVSSEAAWWNTGGDDQEIRCARSTDNGQTWTTDTRACYFPGERDGMPVVVNMQGNKGLVFSIETPTSNLNPSLVHRDLDGEWDTTDWDGRTDDDRWINTNLQGGCAPYIIQLPTGEFVMCAHQNQSGAVWQTCRSSVSIGDSSGHNFGSRTLPFASLPAGQGAYYCQLFLKDPTHLWLAISHSTYDGTDCTKNTIEYIEGIITEK